MVEITYMTIALKFFFRVLSTKNEYILSNSLFVAKNSFACRAAVQVWALVTVTYLALRS
jgi:L-asparagine transporter-like permease